MGFLKKVFRPIERPFRSSGRVGRLFHNKEVKQTHTVTVTTKDVDAGVVVVTDGVPRFVSADESPVECEHTMVDSQDAVEFSFVDASGNIVSSKMSDRYCQKCGVHVVE
eukprot:TRINITY_DN4197_c0_g1_i1.p4 TRINITY_DN4197_c0_g1~~TRINITY_DN4197_c0_g1_i1.p4  ORF type:complete len:109 (+),score=22.97 TRINITY_DN4197_c0_g1_i1:1219-1545(+)